MIPRSVTIEDDTLFLIWNTLITASARSRPSLREALVVRGIASGTPRDLLELACEQGSTSEELAANTIRLDDRQPLGEAQPHQPPTADAIDD